MASVVEEQLILSIADKNTVKHPTELSDDLHQKSVVPTDLNPAASFLRR